MLEREAGKEGMEEGRRGNCVCLATPQGHPLPEAPPTPSVFCGWLLFTVTAPPSRVSPIDLSGFA